MHDEGSARALLPLVLFLTLFFGAGVYFSLHGADMGFYQLHAPVAMLPAVALALFLGRAMSRRPLDVLLEGMGQPGLMQMCLIFLLAGAFAEVTRRIGGVDAVVYLGMQVLPPSFLLPGLFVIAGLISLAMGTSMGTIAAVAPVATGLADAAGLSLPLTLGAVVGGAMFGHNLSVISDTTIAATRSQGAAMRSKFRENIWIALPAALATIGMLLWLPGTADAVNPEPAPALLAAPYVLVLVLALCGVDVLAVLALGSASAGLLGVIMTPDYGVMSIAGDIWTGFQSMFEIMLLSLLVGGLAALMREQGGMDWLVRQIRRLGGKRSGRRTGEAGIAALSVVVDVFTANNTVAILVAGPVVHRLAAEHGIRPGRSASVMDIFSCLSQGMLPYGAQILLAASIAGLSPLAVAAHVHYSWFLAGMAVVAVCGVRLPGKRGLHAGVRRIANRPLPPEVRGGRRRRGATDAARRASEHPVRG